MADNGNPGSVEAAMPAAILRQAQATRLPLQYRGTSGFTLAELLVSVSVLVLLIFVATQLINSATTVAILGNKRIDADSEARQVLDRMAIDFAQMLKRSDVDYYVKLANQQRQQNDQIAFYSAVPGYNPASGAASPVSLVAYRVNSDSASVSYNRMERLGKGLVWNAASTTDTPVVFLPLTISNMWPSAVSTSMADSSYEVIGPDVFRFEYCYLLTNGALSDGPCLDAQNCTVNAWHDVAAIVVSIALIDPRSKMVLTNSNQQIAMLNTGTLTPPFLRDWSQDLNRPGKLLFGWQSTLNAMIRAQTLPRPALAGIRLYERYFYLNK